VFPNVPHHVTQRGNHREQVFFANGDPEAYLALLHAYACRQHMDVVAYCLMPNHVHLVVVPSDTKGMHSALRAVHSQYAQRVNRMRSLTGHLWQGRYFSSPLDENYFLNAVRYVECNPVRAGLVARAENYAWSSAAAHCGIRHDPIIAKQSRWPALRGIADWSRWLCEGIPSVTQETLRLHGIRNLPCGASEFIAALGEAAGKDLTYRKRGGQAKMKRDS
jgi:putative transposase